MCFPDFRPGSISCRSILSPEGDQERRIWGSTVGSIVFVPLLDDVLTGEDKAYVIYD